MHSPSRTVDVWLTDVESEVLVYLRQTLAFVQDYLGAGKTVHHQ